MNLIEKLMSEKSIIVPCNSLNYVYRTAVQMGLAVHSGTLLDNGDRVLYID